MCPGDLGQMTGSSATDVCLSAGAACISFLRSPCTAADLPSGERWEGRGEEGKRRGAVVVAVAAAVAMESVCVCTRRRQTERKRGV